MSEWTLKRFWTETTVADAEGGFSVLLDGRGVRTPAKTALQVPTRPLAEAIAAEWDRQEGQVDPNQMPFTRMANSALDKVTPQRLAVADMLAEYADSDLLCYRADGPDSLVQRQNERWTPYLDWAANAFGARLQPVTGLMHSPQPPQALARLKDEVRALDPFQLAAFHDLVCLTGSLVLGFAASRDFALPDVIWADSRLDEIWQAEQWGEDAEAAELAQTKGSELAHAKAFWDLTRRL